MRVGGTRRGDAGGGRELRFFARGVRAEKMGTIDVVFIYLADDVSSAAGDGQRGDRVWRIFDVPGEAGAGAGTRGARRADRVSIIFVIQENYNHRKNFHADLGGCGGDD